jgi:hypothetical protein
VITVVIPVSPVPSHPDTSILDQTVTSVRHHLPDAELILMFDGVRNEQVDRKADYEEFIRRVLWKADHDPLWRPVCPFVFDEHLHQVGMLRNVIGEIRTPLMLWVEQDCPLVCDEPIDWESCIELLMSGEADIVRLHHESHILDAHRHMTFDQVGQFVRTSQYSGRPHLAAVDWYEQALAEHFSPEANTYLEDVLHGTCSEAYIVNGMDGWRKNRIWVYHPDGGNIKRSIHIDGRAGDPKFDELLRF